jgi:protocatechuate 3,4-dioxygenase beta subunit
MKERSLDVTRRRFLVSGAALATTLQLQRAALAAGLKQEADVCRLAAEQEVGPYYVADELLRSDIVEKKPGIPLSLRILVLDARTCKPLQNAAVDIWHCDALGLYAGFTKQNPMGPGGPDGHGGPPPGFEGPDPGHSGPPEGMGPPPESHPTDKLTFLRGIQITDAEGAVNFKTVFPGFYMGRTNHIHFKVRVGGHADGKTYAAGHTSHTGQVFFPEHMAAELMLHEPYKSHNIHRTTQAEDAVFTDQHGAESVAKVQPLYVNNFRLGMHADIVATVDPTATPGPAQRRMGASSRVVRRRANPNAA